MRFQLVAQAYSQLAKIKAARSLDANGAMPIQYHECRVACRVIFTRFLLQLSVEER